MRPALFLFLHLGATGDGSSLRIAGTHRPGTPAVRRPALRQDQKKGRTNMADPTTRKPLLLLRFDGWLLFRYTARTLLELLFHEPPRSTRMTRAIWLDHRLAATVERGNDSPCTHVCVVHVDCRGEALLRPYDDNHSQIGFSGWGKYPPDPLRDRAPERGVQSDRVQRLFHRGGPNHPKTEVELAI